MARKSRKTIETATEQNTQMQSFTAGAYIRLSSVDRKNKGDSLENQHAIINACIKKQNDIELREIYIDNGYSGQSFERPAFQQMLADMESGKINCCITKDLSRLGRNAIDSGYYIEKHFPAIGIRYIAVTDNYDSADGQSGGFIISLKNMLNEAYALDVSRKIQATVRMNIRKGKFVGSSAPYGYFKSSEDCHKLVIDEYTAPIVRHMFEMAATGQRHQLILAWLNDSKIMPPRRYMRSIGLASDKETGALTEWWSLRAVRDVLKNKVYCGIMIQGRSRMVGRVQTNTPENEWTVTENAHEAIISNEIFTAAQKNWVRKSKPSESYYKLPNTENIFARKLFCGQCGHALIRKRGGEKFYRYICNVGIYYTKDACSGLKITETAMKEIMLDMIRKYEPFLTNVIYSIGNTAANNVISINNNLQNELAAVQSEISKNSRFLIGLYESLMQNDISDNEYREMKHDYETKIHLLTERATHLQESIQLHIKQEKSFSQAHKSIRTIEQISDLTADIIDKLVEKIYVYQDKRLGIKFRFLTDVVYTNEEIYATGANGGGAYE